MTFLSGEIYEIQTLCFWMIFFFAEYLFYVYFFFQNKDFSPRSVGFLFFFWKWEILRAFLRPENEKDPETFKATS